MTTPPGLGQVVYLASALIKVTPKVIQTFPDTPNQYTADLKVMGDPGGWDLSVIDGPRGPAGRAFFELRDAYDVDPTRPVVNTPGDLPTDLTNLASDIGLYWVIDTLDSHGHVIMTTAWVWYGTGWREFMTGAFGPPGPVPEVQPTVIDIDPSADAFIAVSGPTLEPSWQFNLPVPAGPPGPVGPLALFPDVSELGVTLTNPSVLGVNPTTTDLVSLNGQPAPVWQPMTVNPAVIGPYSMPQSAFTAYVGIDQYFRIGSFTVPAQAYDWTPAVWGHLCAGALSGQASQKVGVLVILGDDSPLSFKVNPSLPASNPLSVLGDNGGVLIARGLGSRSGEVNIYPHYSTPQTSSVSITPKNNLATVPAGQTATINVGLWNDGHIGLFTFAPTSSPPPLATLATNISNTINNPIATLDNVGTALNNFVGTIRSDLQNAMNTIAHLLSGIHLPSPIQNIITTLQGVPADVRAFVQAIPADVAATVANFKAILQNVGQKLGLSGVPDALGAIVSELQTNISTGIHTVTSDVQSGIDNLGNALGLTGTLQLPAPVTTLVSNFQTGIHTLAADLGLGNIPNPLAGVQQALQGIGTNIASNIQAGIDNIGNMLGLNGTGLLGQDVANAIGDFSTILNNTLNNFNLGQLADPFTTVSNALSNLASQFQAGIATLTADIQNSIDNIANAFGLTGTGNPITQITNALATLQPALDNAANQLGLVTIPALQAKLAAFTGTVTTDVRTALDTLTSRLNQGIGHTVTEVHTILGNIQTAIDNVASHLGFQGIGHNLIDLIGGLVSRIGQPLDSGLQGALQALGNLIGVSGLITNANNALTNLEPLLGSILSRFTTDAQVYVNVLPINPSPLQFLEMEG